MSVVVHRNGDEFFGRGVNLAIISIVFTFTAFCLVTSRLVTRWKLIRKLGADDCAIVASMLFSLGLTISNCISVAHGIGKASNTLSPPDLHIALQTFWAAQILYKFTINLTKTSICLLYLRIFPSQKFRQTVYLVMGYVLLYAFASIIATIFECIPLEKIWKHSLPGTCINLTAFWYSNAAANIIGDFTILCLPMPVVRSLHLGRRQKWGLAMVFALGGFVCITSILRMTTLDTGSKNQDQTYGTLNSTIWTTIEANTGIICACLPMLKSPLAFLFPRLFPRNSYTDYSSRSDVVSRGPSRVTASRDGESPAAYDGWGRLQSQRPINLIRVPVPAKLSSDTSSDGTFGMSCQDIPMGHITKTVHVDVKYGDRNLCPPNPSPNGSQHSKERVRSISQVPLVGQDCHQFA
ncbi:hypothetical protein MMC28_004238 [Mycoblastus sanguinarius]|nr:hypothetical protein [Mycoblastus sanguinarius]